MKTKITSSKSEIIEILKPIRYIKLNAILCHPDISRHFMTLVGNVGIFRKIWIRSETHTNTHTHTYENLLIKKVAVGWSDIRHENVRECGFVTKRVYGVV